MYVWELTERRMKLAQDRAAVTSCINAHGFDVQVTAHRDKFLIINQLDAPISQIYFWNETLHVSDSSSVQYMFHSQNKFEKLVHLIGLL
jgi:hypothetical protein